MQLEPGDDRTDRQREAAERISDLASRSGYSGQRLTNLFHSDKVSGAAVLMALMQRDPDPRQFEEVLKWIETPPDEGQRLQYDALRALQEMLGTLGRENLEIADSVIRKQPFLNDPGNVGRYKLMKTVRQAIKEEVSGLER